MKNTMRRAAQAVVAIAVVLACRAVAHAQGIDYWFNYQNTAGLAPVIAPGGGACFLYSSAAFDEQCYTSIPSTFVTGLYYQSVQDAALGVLPQEPILGTGFDASAGLCSDDDPGNTRTNVGLCSIGAVDSGAGTKLVSRVISDSFGRATFASAVGLAADMTESGGNLTQADYPLVSRSTNAPTNAVNMGALASGVNEQTVSAGVATPVIFSAGANRIPTGAVSNGQLIDSANFTYDGTEFMIGTATPFLATGETFSNSTAGGNFVNVVNTSASTSAYAGMMMGLEATYGAKPVGFFGVFPTGSVVFDPKSLLFELQHGGTTGNLVFSVLDSPGGAIQFRTHGRIDRMDIGDDGHVKVYALSASHMVKTDGSDFLASATAGTDYQVPLTACTDYVSLSCVSGGDLGGTNTTPTVVGIEDDAVMRGDLLAAHVSAPTSPSSGNSRIYVDATSDNICSKSSVGVINHGIQSNAGLGNKWVSAIADDGTVTLSQPAFSNLSGDICSVIPATATPCGSTTAYGSTGSYLAGATTDAVGRTISVTTTTTPLAAALVYTMASTGLSIGADRATLVMPLPAGSPIQNTAAAGTAVSTTLAANWGSSSQSPPTFVYPTLGSVRCDGDITFYKTSGTGSASLVAALWANTAPRVTPGNWTLIASSTISLGASAGGSSPGGIAFSASSGSGLAASAALVFVFYRSDASPSTLTAITDLNANVICALGI